MPRYSAPFTKSTDSVAQLVDIVTSATLQRQKWFAFVVGNTATPADAVFSFVVRRVMATATTGTTLTPNAIDPADAACRSTSKHIITADHGSFASGAELWRTPINHRATYQWMASEGRELVGAATATGTGLSLGLGTASASTFGGTVSFEE